MPLSERLDRLHDGREDYHKIFGPERGEEVYYEFKDCIHNNYDPVLEREFPASYEYRRPHRPRLDDHERSHRPHRPRLDDYERTQRPYGDEWPIEGSMPTRNEANASYDEDDEGSRVSSLGFEEPQEEFEDETPIQQQHDRYRDHEQQAEHGPPPSVAARPSSHSRSSRSSDSGSLQRNPAPERVQNRNTQVRTSFSVTWRY